MKVINLIVLKLALCQALDLRINLATLLTEKSPEKNAELLFSNP